MTPSAAPSSPPPSSAPGPLVGVSVCVVGINYEPEQTGIAPYTTALAQALLAAGARVRVVTGVPHYPQWRITDAKYRRGLRWAEEIDGVTVTRVRHAVPRRSTLRARLGMELTFLVQAARVLVRDRSDVVVAVSPSLSGLAAAVLTRRGRRLAAVVQDLTGSGAAESGTTGSRVAAVIGAAEFALLRRVDAVGVVSEGFRSSAVGRGVPAETVVDVRNFTHIEPSAVGVSEARERLGWARDRVTVVHTGNMGRKQGLELAIEAARGADFDLVLVGDGNERATLEQHAAGLPNVHFVDPLSREDYPLALAAADVLLLNERVGVKEMSLPSKITSYVCAGRPIVAAVEPGGATHRELTRYGAAHLVAPGSPTELSGGVARLGADQVLRREVLRGAEGLAADAGHRAAAVRYVRLVQSTRAPLPERRSR
ncbi:glycosyltransferase [Rhodococcus aerolatus]